MMPGIYELILIFGIVALLFGTKKIKSVGSDIGSWIKDFRKAVKEDPDESTYANKDERIIDIKDVREEDKS